MHLTGMIGTPPEQIKSLYAQFKASTGIALYIDQLQPGQIFFGLSHRGTRAGYRSWLIRVWGLLEILAPRALTVFKRGLLMLPFGGIPQGFIIDLGEKRATTMPTLPTQ